MIDTAITATIVVIVFGTLLVIVIIGLVLSIRQVIHNHQAYIKNLHKHCKYCDSVIKEKGNPNYNFNICTKDECMLMEYHKNKQEWPE